MSALPKVAMGLVLTLVDAVIGGYDAVPDVLGWVLVVLGLRDLRARLPVSTLMSLAVLAGVVSLVTLRPALLSDLPESTGWVLSLPQVAFSLALCSALAHRLTGWPARRFRILRAAFVAVAAGPVLVYGGGLDLLVVPLAVFSVAVNVYLVYLLFRSARDGAAIGSTEDVGPTT
jgi:hypothetical protein